MFDEVLRFCG